MENLSKSKKKFIPFLYQSSYTAYILLQKTESLAVKLIAFLHSINSMLHADIKIQLVLIITQHLLL